MHLSESWAVLLFLIAAVFVLYTLFGYPLLLAFLSRRRPGPAIQKDPLYRALVSVVMPVKNGERWLAAKLDSLLAMDYPHECFDAIYVISDGSTDRTAEIVTSYAHRNTGVPVKLLNVPPGGKALALNAAFGQVRGDILFLTDVRQPLEKTCLSQLVACFADPTVGAVSGELIIRDGTSSEEANTGLYWKYEKWIRKGLSKIDSVLGATGAVYAIRRSLAAELPAGTLLDDVHLPLNAFFQGYRVILDDSARAYDIPTSLDSEFRRKVRTLAGNYQLLGRFPALLLPWRNRMWIHFMSHKFGRLILPWALLLAAAASLFLPPPWRALAVAAQLGFYSLAYADRWLPEGFVLKKLSSPVRTFCVLMAATALAASILISPKRQFWK